jgi:hypothetical protein
MYWKTFAANSGIPSVKVISGGTLVDTLFSEFQGLIRPTGVQCEVCHNTVHHIRTAPGTQGTCPPRRLATDRLALAEAKFDALLRDGTTRHSVNSSFSALHIVPKKANGCRPCGDYRALNVRTILERCPIRHIHDYSHQLNGCCFFSKLDLVRA